ncbi:MAG TPA: hypothetical protein VMV41_00745, partial [Cellulomonadaceae bacterium]|nr:hypothetical protein [Cellulomonadaceae bacterium]
NLVGGTALASVVSTVSTKIRPHGYVFGGPDRAGVWQTPCQLTSVAAFPAGSTSSQIFTAPRPVIVPPGPVTVWTATTPVGSLPGYEHVVLLCSAPDGTSGQVSTSTSPLPTASITQISSNTLVLTVTNPTSTTLYAVIPTSWDASPNVFAVAGGSPGLLLSGWSTPIDADIPTVPIASTDSASASLYGPRTWMLPDSGWRQDKTTAQALTDALLPDVSFPRLLLENVQTQWDPRWQLGDVVTVSDALGRMPNQLARITALDPTLSLDVERFMTVKLGLRLIPPTPVTAADYDAWWSGSTAAHHDAQWAAARPGGVTVAQADALPLRVSP